MATAKQIAWRKKFAAMAKAGTLKRGTKKRRKNPAPGVSDTTYDRNPRKKKSATRPSQATGKAPTKRLVARRKKTARVPEGFFANPSKQTYKRAYAIREKTKDGYKTIAFAPNEATAKRVAQLLADQTGHSFGIQRLTK